MSTTKEILVPNIGGATDVEVIEILVAPGQEISKDASLITLEGEKATMEIPSPYEGKVKEIIVKLNDKVSEGSLILKMDVAEEQAKKSDEAKIKTETKSETPATKPVEKAPEPKKPEIVKPVPTTSTDSEGVLIASDVHAGPAVRRLAREFDLDLTLIKGSGEKNRILKEDIQNYVKAQLQKAKGVGVGISPLPAIDFSKFGEVEKVALNKIKRATGVHVHRSWVTVPHVTQFDEADITDLEEFRKNKKHIAEEQGYKLTPLVFIMKAVVSCLKEFPQFNASLDSSGESLIMKKYFHIGIAVDTPEGLVVPVIRDVDQKGMFDLAKELAEVSAKARQKSLTPGDMMGSSFTISSLGGIGGTSFTPIVNMPDVAILGVSRSTIKPVYQNERFVPRLMLPLSLSYDHRVIDGADGARFIVHLTHLLTDVKTLLLL